MQNSGAPSSSLYVPVGAKKTKRSSGRRIVRKNRLKIWARKSVRLLGVFFVLLLVVTVALLLFAHYDDRGVLPEFVQRYLPDSGKGFKYVGNPPGIKGLQKSRFRRSNLACASLAMLKWSLESRFWLHPMCRHALLFFTDREPVVYAPELPTSLYRNGYGARASETPRNSSKAIDMMKVWVPEAAAVGNLANIVGSEFAEQHWNSAVVLDGGSGHKYMYKFNATEGESRFELEDSFYEWVQQAREGRAALYQKVEMLEEMPLSGGSSADFAPMDINSEFFDRYIANRTARATELGEALHCVVFHAPWCGHCRVFLSKFEPAAREVLDLATNTRIGFYKLDVTANDVRDDRYRITRVPTTLCFNHHDDNPIEFVERNNVKGRLVSFLQEHSFLPNEL